MCQVALELRMSYFKIFQRMTGLYYRHVKLFEMTSNTGNIEATYPEYDPIQLKYMEAYTE